MDKILDIYTDYLICQNKLATATGLSEMVSGAVSHDQVTRYLNGSVKGSKELWSHVKSEIRRHATDTGGVLILDDTIEEKPYTDENEIVCWHHCHSKQRHVKGVNILSCLVRYGDIVLPVGYEIVHKDTEYYDEKKQKQCRKASITKNEHFRDLIQQSVHNQVQFDHVLADNWFAAKDNLDYIHHKMKKKFIIGIKSNRTIALSIEDKQNKNFKQVKDLDMEDGETRKVWLRDNNFEVQLLKKVFTNEDGSTGILYLISNDLDRNGEALYDVYQKRWQIEVYHKSIKQNASLAKSPTKLVKSQSNHIFSSIVAFCKLEKLKICTALNHFALKCKLLITANQAALAELKNLQKLMQSA